MSVCEREGVFKGVSVCVCLSVLCERASVSVCVCMRACVRERAFMLVFIRYESSIAIIPEKNEKS